MIPLLRVGFIFTKISECRVLQEFHSFIMIKIIIFQMFKDIQGVENAFSDLHRRYEKLKTVVEEQRKVYHRFR